MPALDHPTAEELREQRTWRVVTLCCESTDPDWHGQGAFIPPGGQVLIRVQGYLDGRCGWTEAVHDVLGPRDLVVGREVLVTIDDVPAVVTPMFTVTGMAERSLGAHGVHALRLAQVPEHLATGPHRLAIRYRACTWSGTLEVGTPAPTSPPAPTLSADFQWVHLPDYGGAVWWDGRPYDLSPEHWLHLPPHASYDPVVLCVIDAQGRSHGAWEVRDTEDDKYTLVHSNLVQIDYPPCDALK